MAWHATKRNWILGGFLIRIQIPKPQVVVAVLVATDYRYKLQKSKRITEWPVTKHPHNCSAKEGMKAMGTVTVSRPTCRLCDAPQQCRGTSNRARRHRRRRALRRQLYLCILRQLQWGCSLYLRRQKIRVRKCTYLQKIHKNLQISN